MNIDSAEELRAPWEVIRDEKRKKKDEFMESMIKVKFTINSTMLKNYMIQEYEDSCEGVENNKGDFAEYRNSVRGHNAKYFLDHKRNLELQLAEVCRDKFIYELEWGTGDLSYEYNEFTKGDFTEEF
tara:strand:+ start:72 stop:452 length:381 start_codon:yes stop_codon:yes gene_type:complete